MLGDTVCISVAIINTVTTSNLRGKGLIWIIAYWLQSIMEGSRKPEAGMEDHKTLLLHTLLPLACPAVFFIQPRTTANK